MQLSIPLIGWFFTVLSLVALIGGLITMTRLRRGGPIERAAAQRHALRDYLTFGIWIAGLAGGAGVLMHKLWGLHVLEFFCYALIVLMCTSIYNRYRDLKAHAKEEHINWLAALGGLAIVGIPVVVICYLTISALRSESVRALFLP